MCTPAKACMQQICFHWLELPFCSCILVSFDILYIFCFFYFSPVFCYPHGLCYSMDESTDIAYTFIHTAFSNVECSSKTNHILLVPCLARSNHNMIVPGSGWPEFFHTMAVSLFYKLIHNFVGLLDYLFSNFLYEGLYFFSHDRSSLDRDF